MEKRITETPRLPKNRQEKAERLEAWAKGLELVAKDEHFKLGWSWVAWTVHREDRDARLALSRTEAFKQRKCGTTACAGGWLPELFPGIFCHANMNPTGFPVLIEVGGHLDSAARWFGLGNNQWNRITSPEQYEAESDATRFDVAERIREIRDEILGAE